MRDFSPLPQDFTELALHAFAANGYVPSAVVLKAAVKNLARLSDPLPGVVNRKIEVSFDEMLRSCAGV